MPHRSFEDLVAAVRNNSRLPKETPLPSQQDVARELAGDYMEDARLEAARRILATFGFDDEPIHDKATGLPHDLLWIVDDDSLDADWLASSRALFKTLAGSPGDPASLAEMIPPMFDLINMLWEDEDYDRPRHPLAPLIDAWFQRPTMSEVEIETRKDSRILPVVRDRKLPILGGLTRRRTLNDLQLPMLPNTKAPSVPLLNAVDAAVGLPIMARGRGAPLQARLFVYAALAVQLEDRKLPDVPLPLSVRTLRDMLWPNGWEKRHDWPRLREALFKARDVAIRDSDGALWFPLALAKLPPELDGGPDLDDVVLLKPESTEGGRGVSVLEWQGGAPALLG